MNRPLRVLVADDNRLARDAIIHLLSQDPAFDVAGEAADGYAAVEKARELEPDLILMDINMPRCDGLMATRLVKQALPHVAVVVLTVSDDAQDLFAAIRSGAQGYLTKSLEPQEWLEYLRGFARGEVRIPREMARRILAEFQSPHAATAGAAPGLTEREVEVLRLIAVARTNREIAAALYISELTVKNHIKNILEKLQLRNRVELAIYAHSRGLVPLSK